MPDAYFIPRQLRVRGGGNFTSDINLSAGGVDLAVFNASSGTNLVSYGYHYSTGTTATFLLSDPEVGRDVAFVAGAATTGTTYTVLLNNTATFFVSTSGGANARQIALNGGAGVHLVGLTTALYGVLANYGNTVGSSST